jgi:hypothetical protein
VFATNYSRANNEVVVTVLCQLLCYSTLQRALQALLMCDPRGDWRPATATSAESTARTAAPLHRPTRPRPRPRPSPPDAAA